MTYLSKFFFLILIGSFTSCADKTPPVIPAKAPVITVAESVPPELEFQFAELRDFSTQGTHYYQDLIQQNLTPRGAALRTDSGALVSQGIQAIIHAAPGQPGGQNLSAPSLEGVRLSVANSLILAKRFNYTKIAIPLIGGAIFRQAIGVDANTLADVVVQSALRYRKGLELVFIDLDRGNFQALQSAFQRALLLPEFQNQNLESFVQVRFGNITLGTDHGCPVIVNAANMSVTFGGGVSGAIGAAAGPQSNQINQAATASIHLFNQRLLTHLGAQNSMASGTVIPPTEAENTLVVPTPTLQVVPRIPQAPAPSTHPDAPAAVQSQPLVQPPQAPPLVLTAALPPAALVPSVPPQTSLPQTPLQSLLSNLISSQLANPIASMSPSGVLGSSSSSSPGGSTVASLVEIEFADSALSSVSTQLTTYSQTVASQGAFPKGSAIRTPLTSLISSSGPNFGIGSIIHGVIGERNSASGPAFSVEVEAIRRAVQNAMILANRFNHHRIAIPLFAVDHINDLNISQLQLVKTIVRIALAYRGNVEIVFLDALNSQEPNFNDVVNEVLTESVQFQHIPYVQVLTAGILEHQVHKADVVFVPTDLLGSFGSGDPLNTQVAQAVGQASGQINTVSQLLLQARTRLSQLVLADLLRHNMSQRAAANSYSNNLNQDPYQDRNYVPTGIDETSSFVSGAGSASPSPSLSLSPSGGTPVVTQPASVAPVSAMAPAQVPPSTAVAAQLRQEIEFQDPQLEVLSTEDTLYRQTLLQQNLLPKGSALATSSGLLLDPQQPRSIGAIIHAVIGNEVSINETATSVSLESISLAVKNAMVLAKRFNHRKVAIPLVGAQYAVLHTVFDPGQLAERVVRSVLVNRGNLDIVFVDFNSQQVQYLQSALNTALSDPLFSAHRPHVQVIQGNLVQFASHQADVIVIPTSLSVQFASTGVSVAIGTATGQPQSINQLASQKITLFNQLLTARLGGQSEVAATSPSNGVALVDPYYNPNRQGLGNQPSLQIANSIAIDVPPGGISPDLDPQPAQVQSSSAEVDHTIPYIFEPLPAPTISPSQTRYLNLPQTEVEESVFCHHYRQGPYQTTAQIRQALLSIAQPAPSTMVWYRWGVADFEYERIGLNPPFNLKTRMNIGGIVYGKGLYVSSSPVGSMSYGDSAGQGVGMITLTAPAGTPLIDLSSQEVIRRIGDLGFSSPALVVQECNPPVMVKVPSAWGAETWWVLKTGENVRVGKFDGRFLSTEDILNYRDRNFSNHAVATTRAVYQEGISATLSRRVFNPNASGAEKVPHALTASIPLNNWSQNPLLTEVDSNRNRYIQNAQSTYYFRWDGTCGEYYQEGAILVNDQVDVAQCKVRFPTQYRMEADAPINFRGVQTNRCFEVLRQEPRIKVGGEVNASFCTGR